MSEVGGYVVFYLAEEPQEDGTIKLVTKSKFLPASLGEACKAWIKELGDRIPSETEVAAWFTKNYK